MRRTLLSTLLALAITGASHGAVAAGVNAPLLDAARKAEPAVIETLKSMVLIESGSSDAAGLARMADYTEGRLKALGMSTERKQGTTGPGSIVIGSLAGTGSKRLMLIAHMDTVYPTGTLATQPYKVEGNRIYGPGIADDKGGIAVILHALQLLKDAGWRDYSKLTVAFNADEEIGSIGSGDLIASLGAEQDYVLSSEPSPAQPEIVLLGASGTGTVTLKVQGRSAHAGAAPELGRNALIELSHQLVQTRDVAKSVPGTQLNWTVSQAGQVRNQIPEAAVATGDMRLTVPDGFEKLEAALKEKVQNRLVPDTQTTVSIERGRPPFVASPAAREVAKKAQEIYGEIDRKLTLVDNTGGATDAGFAAKSGKAIVLESFGLGGAGYHARDEYIVTDTIVPRLYLMSRMLQEVAQAK
ncbi:M20/M25/M40 family metallo-hydrolase [Noviherbaspirillum suwonense]|jgi:glutamate carboxypeptidase|uniref:Glutamate carboxypeptidase n=1 Tax=Noviherbaspirillum suwonense TaxID=1224511 RepID=A0ABY1QR04_9BURK|nr:M20/M25/M40 family metallo-hydrolase [Noviherbaspirillum suwonense]SMP77910.1 glutamate carboxypeptidase [Noviherbaspirillum suwonense]